MNVAPSHENMAARGCRSLGFHSLLNWPIGVKVILSAQQPGATAITETVWEPCGGTAVDGLDSRGAAC